MPTRSSALFLASALVALASCSSSDDASDGTDVSAPVSASATEVAPAPADTELPTTDPVTPDQAATDNGAEAPPVTEVPSSEPAPDVGINGPASVNQGAAGCSNDVPTGLIETSIVADGTEYDVRFYVPTTFASDSLLPVVFNWHGLGSTGDQQAVFTGYETLAESEGFIVVHATGVVDERPDARGNSWELTDDQDAERDDLAFVDTLLDEVVGTWCGDPNRIYSTGMSNGGFFTARLVCERADRFAAAVSIAGTFHQDDCSPSRAVPYRAYHGTADDVVPFTGGGSVLVTADSDPLLVELLERVISDEFFEFAEDAGCAATPEISTLGDDVTRYDYVGCADDVPISFFEVAEGGHTWPNTPILDVVGDALGYTTTTVDATVDGWEFMSQFSLADSSTD